jgi:xylulokinase/erythritol kinase
MNVGVDIGTSVTKAVVFDDHGSAAFQCSANTQLISPARGRYEYDLDAVAWSVIELLRRLDGRDVDVVALTGQGDGLCLTDGTGRPVAPAISWLDARGASICEQWAQAGVVSKLFALTGNAPFPGAGAALLASVGADSPEILQRAATAAHCQTALFERLTGVRGTAPSCAVLPVFDPARGEYHAEAVELCGLSPHVRLLAPVSPEPVLTAPILPDVADVVGIRRGTTIATGPYDLPATALGAGLSRRGDGLLILGTTLACQVLVEEVPTSGDAAGLTLVAGDDTGYLRAMPAMVGTSCLDWVLRLVGAQHSELDALIAKSTPGANGVHALPYLSPAGERAPFLDLEARAELSGLTLDTGAHDVVRALCESLAYAARQCFEAAGLTGDVRVCGGGAASSALLQLFADVLNRPLHVLSGELGALGAVCAASGMLIRPASRGTVVAPNSAATAIYDAGYADYLSYLDAARNRWHRASGQRATQSGGLDQLRGRPATT